MFYHSEVSYHFHTRKPTESLPQFPHRKTLFILYFLCDTREIAEFFAAHTRSNVPVLYLLNSNRYASPRELLLFQRAYRLDPGTVFAPYINPAFQRAILLGRKNHFFTFYNQATLCNQNYDYIRQLKQIHFTAVELMKGTNEWKTKNYLTK